VQAVSSYGDCACRCKGALIHPCSGGSHRSFTVSGSEDSQVRGESQHRGSALALQDGIDLTT